ncbi:MAG: DUF4166 domain-containing protein [Hyphomicrobiaceae bacterium]
MTPLFHRAMGEAALRTLPQPIVVLHDVCDVRTWHGRSTVARGTTVLARLAALVMRFPPDGRDRSLNVRMRATPRGEEWSRSFDGWPLVTSLEPGPVDGTIRERLGPVAAVSRLEADAAGVTQHLVGLRVMGLPAPRWLWPSLDVREGAEGTRYTFRMRIDDPWGRLVIAYEGWLATDTRREG